MPSEDDINVTHIQHAETLMKLKTPALKMKRFISKD